jgi:hypothetical protein
MHLDTTNPRQSLFGIYAMTAAAAARRRFAALACLALCTFGGAASSAMASDDVTLLLEPSQAVVKEDEPIAITLVFVAGAHETTLILPMGADPTGILTYRAIEVASGREWAAADLDPRSFAADARERVPAGGRRELNRSLREFEAPKNFIAVYQPARNLPPGKYRIVAVYDEGRTFRIENRTSRVLRSEPAEIEVTPR